FAGAVDLPGASLGGLFGDAGLVEGGSAGFVSIAAIGAGGASPFGPLANSRSASLGGFAALRAGASILGVAPPPESPLVSPTPVSRSSHHEAAEIASAAPREIHTRGVRNERELVMWRCRPCVPRLWLARVMGGISSLTSRVRRERRGVANFSAL